MITVLTPTYNRAYTLKNAYNSLLNQTNKDFEWLIIDDGSTDNTKELIDSFIKENKIKTTYIFKDNGGKHTALNIGFEKAKGDYIIILDSDDILTDNAIEITNQYINKYKDYKNICGFSFLKSYPNKQIVGKRYKGNEIISNHIDFRYKKGLSGDMCEVYKTSILKKHPLPVFKGEKFVGEGFLWRSIALEYNTIYINEPIYICEYLEDGLSKNSLKINANNPIGASENANDMLTNIYPLKLRLREGILYTAYSKFAKKSFKEIQTNSKDQIISLITYIPGILAYMYIKSKI